MSRESRRQRLRELMDRRSVGALLLQRPANFAWYTGGADNRVDHADPLGVAAILLTTDDECVLTDNIEAPRMREEETPGFEVLEHPWHEGPAYAMREVVAGDAPLAADHALEGGTDVSQAIAPLRYVLDEEAIERYRRVGRDAAAAVTEAMNSLSTYERSELQVAARLEAACRRRGISTPVLMAALEERMDRYRHPILRRRSRGRKKMMIVLCAERGGLYANLTRILLFEDPGEEVVRRQRSCETILCRMREATVPGRTLAEVFEDCKRFYAEEGFPGEWKNHHQGGLTGYASREVIATPDIRVKIEPGMAFAWNPSITGAKAEDTFVLTESGPEVICGSQNIGTY